MCQKYMAAGHTRDNTPQRWWSRTAGLETVYACESVCVCGGGFESAGQIDSSLIEKVLGSAGGQRECA